jgi:hypothetical protein
MKCSEIQELFGAYFDAPAGDSVRALVDEHVRGCPGCREEFDVWAESAELIRSAQEMQLPAAHHVNMADRVMNRIYEGESWRLPVADKIYTIPYKIRRNLTTIIAVCLCIFVISFLYSLVNEPETQSAADGPSPYGFHPAASASGGASDDTLNIRLMNRTAVASAAAIIRPVKLGPIHTSADYFLALSLLGMVCALLIMNWFSRTKV